MPRQEEYVKYLGIAFMILGGIVVLTAMPFAPLAVVQVGPIKFIGLSELSVTRLAVGAVLVFLGFKVYKG